MKGMGETGLPLSSCDHSTMPISSSTILLFQILLFRLRWIIQRDCHSHQEKFAWSLRSYRYWQTPQQCCCQRKYEVWFFRLKGVKEVSYREREANSLLNELFEQPLLSTNNFWEPHHNRSQIHFVYLRLSVHQQLNLPQAEMIFPFQTVGTLCWALFCRNRNIF
jgi:hypothetical protein